MKTAVSNKTPESKFGVCHCGLELTEEEFMGHGLGFLCPYKPEAVKATFEKRTREEGRKE